MLDEESAGMTARWRVGDDWRVAQCPEGEPAVGADLMLRPGAAATIVRRLRPKRPHADDELFVACFDTFKNPAIVDVVCNRSGD
jgi:hypothetical protein